MASLYQIDKDIENCIHLDTGETVNAETGEIMTAEALDQLQMERSAKIKNIALMIKNLRAEGKACGDEAEVFQKRSKSAYNRADWLEEYLGNILDGEKVKDTEFMTVYRKSKAVNITDEKKIPSQYLVQKAPTISKSEIMKALKAGEEVPGAVLVERNKMHIK